MLMSTIIRLQSQRIRRSALRLKKTVENHSVNLSELYKINSPILDVRGVLEFSGATPLVLNTVDTLKELNRYRGINFSMVRVISGASIVYGIFT